MPTRMHRAIGFRRVIQTGLFVDRQRVHVGAQPDDLARSIRLALDHAHNPGAANARDDLIAAELPQELGHPRACAMRVEQNFRVLVKISPPNGDFILQFRETVLNRHWVSLLV